MEIVLAGCWPPPPPTVTIGFDTDDFGKVIASGTLIDPTTYLLRSGVVFGCLNGQAGANSCSGNSNNNPGNVYAVNPQTGTFGFPPHSSPNVFAIETMDLSGHLFNAQNALGWAGFTIPQQQVGVWVYPVQNPEGSGSYTNYAYI